MDFNKIKKILDKEVEFQGILSRINFKAIIFYLFLFLFILALSTTAKIYDYDLWARLIVGKFILQTGHVPMHDFLSYTPTHLWYDHEWGSSVIFYFIQKHFYGAGILILESFLVFLSFFFVVKTVELRGVKTTHAYNFLFYFFAYSTMSYQLRSPIRCQLFSFLLFAIFIYLLERARKNSGKNLELYISVPILMIIWNNLHGGCVSGIGLIFMYVVGEFLNKKPVKKYIIALVLAVIVLPINPWGFDYLPFLLKANTMQRKYVTEWWSIFFYQNLHKYIKFKIFALIMVFIESGFLIKGFISKKLDFDKTKFIVLISTLTLAIMHVKMIPLFVISAGCFLYDDFYTFFNWLTRNLFKKIWFYKDFVVYCFISIFIFTNLSAKSFEPIVSINNFPLLSVEFVRINNLKGNLLTNLAFGSYASYKLYPNNKIFMDGRYEEVYPDFLMTMLKDFHLVENNWDVLLKKYPPDVMIIENYYPIYNVLISSPDWKLVYNGDRDFGVFVKTKDLRKTYKFPSYDVNYYRKTVFDTKINFVLQSNHEQK